MSGPKSYSPPPRNYSLSVFDGQLNDVFRLQARLESILRALDAPHVELSDVLREAYANWRAQYEPEIGAALRRLTLSQSGTFGQARYNELNAEVSTFRTHLTGILERAEDFEAALQLEGYVQRAVETFSKSREAAVTYVCSYLDNADTKQVVAGELRQIAPTMPVWNTFEGCSREVEERKAQVMGEIHAAERRLMEARRRIGERLLGGSKAKGGRSVAGVPFSPATDTALAAEVEAWRNRLRELVSAVSDAATQHLYENRIAHLVDSQSFNVPYFYKELFDDIRAEEYTRACKRELESLIKDLGQTPVDPEYALRFNELTTTACALSAAQRIKPREMEHLIAGAEFLNAQYQEHVEESLIRRRELQFVKNHIIEILTGMNYEVLTDMQVIDFDSASDVILLAPDQNNVVNLTFDEEGSMVYRFLIPEARDNMSIEEKSKKLLEMQSACRSFKAALKDLASVGINIEARRENAITEDALIQIPERHLDKVATVRKRKRKAHSSQKRLRLD